MSAADIIPGRSLPPETARFSGWPSPGTTRVSGRRLDLAHHPGLGARLESPRATLITLRGPVAIE
jgi:hypothetical protein